MNRDYLHKVVLVIRQRNMDQLIGLLHESSNQRSLNYGQHLTREQVTTLTSNPSSRNAVVSYLSYHGANVVSETVDGDFLTVEASIALWEEVFNTRIFAFHHTQKDGHMSTTVRAEQYFVPRELHSHIVGVFNLIDMPGSHCTQMKYEKNAESFIKLDPVAYQSAAQYMSSYQMEAYYNMSQNRSWCSELPSKNHSCLSTTLEKFQEYFGVKVEPMDSAFYSGNSSSDDWKHHYAVPHSCNDKFLNTEFKSATSQKFPSVFSCSAGITDWLLSIANNSNPPLVICVDNISEEADMPLFVKEVFNDIAIKLGAVGVTIVVDSGVDGTIGLSDTNEYRPLLYSSSPYVTSIGTVHVRQKYTSN